MFSVTRMSGRLLAIRTADSIDDFRFDEEATIAAQTHIDEGCPVIFCNDLEDLNELFTEPENVELVE